MAKKNEQITIREFISQKDIDELLESAFVEQAEAADELELELSDLTEMSSVVGMPDETDQRLISNDDIASLFKDAGTKPDAHVSAPKDDFESIVNQSDIDALLSGGLDAATPATSLKSEPEDDIGGMISQSDIDALLNGALTPDPPPDAAAAGDEGLVTQSDIDGLLNGAQPTGELPDPETAGGEGLISQADIDALLNGAQPADELPDPEAAGDEGLGLVSQSDIDDLLAGEGSHAVAGDDTFEVQERNADGDLVSQSDIDALLQRALASEEGAGAEKEKSDAVSQSEIDNLLGASPGWQPPEDKEPVPEPVILVHASEMAEVSMPAACVPQPAWYTRKAYLLSAVAVLILLISSSVFFIKPRPRDPVLKPEVLTFPIPKIASQPATAAVDTNVSMPGFLVLAPADNSNITCIAADLLLVFSDTTTAKIIKENEGFVRNVIYGVINEALLSRDRSALDRTKLALSVQSALGGVVHKEMIRSVSFGKFEVI